MRLEAPITITWREYARLLSEAVDGKCLSASLGVESVSLERVPENEWAVKLLSEMRLYAYISQQLDEEC